MTAVKISHGCLACPLAVQPEPSLSLSQVFDLFIASVLMVISGPDTGARYLQLVNLA